uniref:Uncharacterized protein n=1 Tax=uncultured candidate division Zixibacteria bacterium Rifle_16ft_4_minimus_38126 TaxID=1665171 RepID=A0A0H4T9X9_UNCZI|nr:hypothetical protein [uncultured candidate division Zixibacteria bacterium Rifle_16ft_4_minimus_38126]
MGLLSGGKEQPLVTRYTKTYPAVPPKPGRASRPTKNETALGTQTEWEVPLGNIGENLLIEEV